MAPSAPQHADPDVIVVGAGIAGLAAAFRLQERGISVTVRCAGCKAGVGSRC
jgi:glycine/D-amino acid oxidase-like deaminating enzyme